MLILIMGLLLFAMSYINGVFIPENFRWSSNGTIRKDLFTFNLVHFIITFLEAVVLIFLLYLLNKSYLKNVVKSDNYKMFAIYTGILGGVVVLTFTYLEIF